MIVSTLNIQNITAQSDVLLNTSDNELISDGEIDLDLSGVQLLAYCNQKLGKKIKIQLTKSSAELLNKTGLASSITDGYLIFK